MVADNESRAQADAPHLPCAVVELLSGIYAAAYVSLGMTSVYCLRVLGLPPRPRSLFLRLIHSIRLLMVVQCTSDRGPGELLVLRHPGWVSGCGSAARAFSHPCPLFTFFCAQCCVQ
jgi:hypothetical protein